MKSRRAYTVFLVWLLFVFLTFVSVPFVFADSFGKTDVGASSTHEAFIFGCNFTCLEEGTATEISVYLQDYTNAAPNITCALYQSSDLSLVATSSEVQMSVGFTGWVNLSISCSVSNQNYFLCVWSDAVVRKWYDAGATNQAFYDNGESYNSYPDPITPSGYLARAYSIYVTYSPTLADNVPSYSNVDDDGVTQVGLNVSVSCFWSDDYLLNTCYFEHNSTGTPSNISLTISGASSWANTTFQLNFTSGVVVSYRWFCSDNANQWNTTGYYNITTKSLYVTWNLNNSTMGSFFVDGVDTANQTESSYDFNQSISLVGAVASSSYVWESFNWTGGNTASNSYSFYTDGNNTVWCVFDVAGTGTGTTEILYQGRGIVFVVFAIVLALSVIVVLGRKKLTR